MTFIHGTYAECLRVLCGNQGGTANFSFVPNQGRSFFCNRKVFLLQKKPTGQDSVPRFIGYVQIAPRKYGCIFRNFFITANVYQTEEERGGRIFEEEFRS